jgi:Cu(I)-responsive transcriptional regulator
MGEQAARPETKTTKEKQMNIGEASAASGVSAKMIRYYEEIGLIAPAGRTASNYRVYDEDVVNRLRFVRRARNLGFSLEETERLLKLWADKERASSEVKALAVSHIADLEVKIAEMQSMVDTLTHLADSCHGDRRPHCPILADLAGRPAPEKAGA